MSILFDYHLTNGIFIEKVREIIFRIFKDIEDVFFQENTFDITKKEEQLKWLQIEYFTSYVNIDHVIAAILYHKPIDYILSMYFDILSQLNEALLIFDNIDQIKYNHRTIFELIYFIIINSSEIFGRFIESDEIDFNKANQFLNNFFDNYLFFEVERINNKIEIHFSFSVNQKEIKQFIPENFQKDLITEIIVF